MKQIISMLIALAALLCLGGCKPNEEELLVLGKEQQSAAQTAPSVSNDKINESETVAPPSEEPKDEGNSPSEDLKDEGYSPMDGMTIYSAEEKSRIVYDPQKLSKLKKLYFDGTGVIIERKTPIPYSELMEKLGENGVIVAGYATGMRECYPEDKCTMTEFVVTNHYYGRADSKIKIKEHYYLMQDTNGDWYFEIPSERNNLPLLSNDTQVLLFLQKSSSSDYYFKTYAVILLEEDYQNYNEEYETHLLNFFRGEPSEYAEKDDARVEYYLNENNQEVYYFVSSTMVINPWPKRDISDEELLEELQENVVVRIITDYKIKIWPYGHKNYRLGYSTGEFAKSCKPNEQ